MTISDALTNDYIGFEASRRGPDKTAYLTATKIYSTIVADAARYYGTALLTSAVSVGDYVINASTIFTQLVPSAKIEVPIIDSRMNQRKTTLAQSGSDITETRTTVFSSDNQLYIGGKILPGSLRVTQGGPVTLKDAGGTLKNGTVSVGTFFYCDPPYWETEGYGVNFGFEQYEQMAEFMRTCKGKVMVSINDHPAIREAFNGLTMMELDIKYSVSNAHGTPQTSQELVIINWEPSIMDSLF
ncbi:MULTISPECIES: DNA adenine methylase [unclassified Undibacterium]|uniref:DNA adenine methylase n=1 Tax=unclassified Undibacterium TaxID=2630295 RepID=UPI00164A9F2B|nr:MULTISPECIES: DNA adenine methylase [unclassified Undibacterium]MBC3878052.1 DNA adenine methylase [Undibacterium sp. FT79W]